MISVPIWSRALIATLAIVGTMTASCPALAQSDAPPADAADLAYRFRPFIKTTGKEQHRPTNWDWFANHSYLLINYAPASDSSCTFWGLPSTDDNGTYPGIIVSAGGQQVDGSYFQSHPTALTSFPGSDLTAPDRLAPGYSLYLEKKKYRSGQSWADAAGGAGFYAHVQNILDPNNNYADTGKVNIEYTILWAYNSFTCDYHQGDITSFVLVYDRKLDLITRATFSQHGASLVIFSLVDKNLWVAPVNLPGKDINGNSIQTPALKFPQIANYGIEVTSHADHYNPSAPFMYVVQDAATQRYDHVVLFAENNSHELWPNDSGGWQIAATAANAPHTGDGVSYLPTAVQDLGSADVPASPVVASFLHYAGLVGTDGKTFVLHNTWYYPHGRGQPPFPLPFWMTFTDIDPYQANAAAKDKWYGPYVANLWPPPDSSPSDIAVTAYVDPAKARTSYYFDPAWPFPDIDTALSFTPGCAHGAAIQPCGTVSLAPGHYPAPIRLNHAVRFVVTGGLTAVIGR